MFSLINKINAFKYQKFMSRNGLVKIKQNNISLTMGKGRLLHTTNGEDCMALL